jgi:hypothetical protein
MGQHDHTILAVRSILSECFRGMRLARATELARSRNYVEATALLAPQGRLPTDPRELDLLARIAARQRRFTDAERLWIAASRAAPGEVEYRTAATSAAIAGQNWRQTKQMTLAVVVVVVLAGVILSAISLLAGGVNQPAKSSSGNAAAAVSHQGKP